MGWGPKDVEREERSRVPVEMRTSFAVVRKLPEGVGGGIGSSSIDGRDGSSGGEGEGGGGEAATGPASS